MATGGGAVVGSKGLDTHGWRRGSLTSRPGRQGEKEPSPLPAAFGEGFLCVGHAGGIEAGREKGSPHKPVSITGDPVWGSLMWRVGRGANPKLPGAQGAAARSPED